MDTSKQAVPEMSAVVSPAGTPPVRERRSVEEKRRIVEQTLVEEASVARGHGVNANQVFLRKRPDRHESGHCPGRNGNRCPQGCIDFRN